MGEKHSIIKFSKKITPYIRWIGTRIGIAYLILFLISKVTIDYEKTEQKIFTQHLNHLLPNSLSYLKYLSSTTSPYTPNLGDIHYIMNYYKELTIAFPEHPTSYSVLGVLQEYIGEKTNALNNFKEAFRLNPYFVTFGYNLGFAYFQRNEYEKANEVLLKVLETNSIQASAFIKQSFPLQQIIKTNLSSEKEVPAIINNHYQNAYILVAHNYFLLKDYTHLLGFCQKVLSLNIDPKGMLSYYAGISAYYLKYYPQSLFYLENSLKTQGRTSDLLFYMSLNLKQLGNSDAAEKLLKESEYLMKMKKPFTIDYIKILKYEFI